MLSGHKPDDPRLELYMVLKELNVKMYSSELYDNYMNVVDATDTSGKIYEYEPEYKVMMVAEDSVEYGKE